MRRWGGCFCRAFSLKAAQSPFICMPWALLHTVLMECFHEELIPRLTPRAQWGSRSRHWDSTLTDHPSPHSLPGWEGGGENTALL